MFSLVSLRRCCFSAFIASLLLLTACTGEQTLPHIARSGETIVVALDGTQEIGLHDVIRREDLNASILASTGESQAVTVRDVIRVYPDNTSMYMDDSVHETVNAPTQYEGLWLAIVDLRDPDTDAAPQLTDTDSYVAVLSFSHASYTFSDFSIEILPGVGETNPLMSESLSRSTLSSILPTIATMFAPQPHVIVRLSSNSMDAYYDAATGASNPNDLVAGMSVTVQYDPSRFAGPSPSIRSVSNNGNVQLLHSHEQISPTLAQFKVLMMNSAGFSYENRAGAGEDKAHISELAFAITWPEHVIPVTVDQVSNTDIDDTNFLEAFSMMDVEIVAQSGQVITGLQHEMIKPR